MSFLDLSWLTAETENVQQRHQDRIAGLYRGDGMRSVVAIAGRMYGGAHGCYGTNEPDMLNGPEEWLADVFADMRANAGEFADAITFRPVAIDLDPLGVHFIDALLGADVYFHEGQVWSEPLACGLEDLRMPDMDNCEVLEKALKLAQMAIEVSQGRIHIAMPVFSCPINIGINIFGQRLLEAMVVRPAIAKRALRIVNDVILETVRRFMDVVPEELQRNSIVGTRYAPAGFGQIDGCATQLVSAKHYDEFFAPLDRELLGLWAEGGMIHLCGAHAQHIAIWARMPEVRSVQINDRASEDLELYWRGLREDQIIYVGPTENMTVERIMQMTGGRRIVLQWLLEEELAVR